VTRSELLLQVKAGMVSGLPCTMPAVAAVHMRLTNAALPTAAHDTVRSLLQDIFRVFDSLNYLDNLKFGIDAVVDAGGVAEGTICYTGDISDPRKKKVQQLSCTRIRQGASVLLPACSAGIRFVIDR
jgi:hypothetical protein